MKILVVHSFYRQSEPSGENVAVRQMAAALRSGGSEVVELFRFTDKECKKPLFGVRTAVSALTGLDWGRASKAVDLEEIDVINVHNVSPNFGTKWLVRTHKPVVTTVHNYRFTCANGLLFREGGQCRQCVGVFPLAAIRHGCYQKSSVKTAPVAVGPTGRGVAFPVIAASNIVVAQTRQVRDVLVETGVPPERVVEIPGFVEDQNREASPPPSTPKYVFIGRNSPEKGLRELLDIWPVGKRLDVFGTVDIGLVREGDARPIEFRGAMSRERVRHLLPNYTALIFPGLALEGAVPLVVREAMEAGVPVIALAGSSAAEFVVETRAGAVYRTRDDLSLALLAVEQESLFLRRLSRRVFVSTLSKDAWLSKMTSTLRRAAARSSR